jgi:hypothetical protein
MLWILVGCNPNPSGPILGIWASTAGDGYTITIDKVVYDDGFGYFGFDGTIENVAETNDVSGIIYFKYTSSQSDPEVIGKYNAVYYKDLTPDTAQIATASGLVAPYPNPATETLAEAKKKFTTGTVGDYVGFWGAYTKTK